MKNFDRISEKFDELLQEVKKLQEPVRSKAFYKLSARDILWEISALESCESIKNFLDHALIFGSRIELLKHAMTHSTFDGLNLEFGVFQGASINYFAENTPNKLWYGFDSFEGLLEDWPGHHAQKGRFSLEGKLPAVRDNVKLVKGWFNDTLPMFLEKNKQNISFIHIDGDTYPAAETVLSHCVSRFIPGTVLVFDEYLGYPGWRTGEFKAWIECVEKNFINYKYLSFTTNQAAIKITNIENDSPR
jgi:hypothetical protein